MSAQKAKEGQDAAPPAAQSAADRLLEAQRAANAANIKRVLDEHREQSAERAKADTAKAAELEKQAKD